MEQKKLEAEENDKYGALHGETQSSVMRETDGHTHKKQNQSC